MSEVSWSLHLSLLGQVMSYLVHIMVFSTGTAMVSMVQHVKRTGARTHLCFTHLEISKGVASVIDERMRPIMLL